MKRAIALLIALATAFAVTACADENGHDGGHQGSEIPEGEEFNEADVEFATNMIQHHAQALAMVDLTRKRDLSPEVDRLAEDILMAQGPEIETMTDWLNDWDQPIPETVRDHANAHGNGAADMDSDMPGMMSAEDMEALETAQDAEFEDLWLEMMIEHHEGAIEMSQTEQADGEHPDAISLAETIEAAQQEEIELMEGLLAS